MIGERVYPSHNSIFEECPDSEFLTRTDARAAFDPLIAQAQRAISERLSQFAGY